MRTLPLLLTALVAACAAPGARDGEDRHLGPFYDREARPEGVTTQLRPFYWRQEGGGVKRIGILSPLIRYREDEAFKRLIVLPNVFYTERKKPRELRNWLFLFFPFLWVGNDDFLLLPVGGYSKGFLGFGDFLLLTPLYMRSRRISSHPTEPVTFTTRATLFGLWAYGTDGRAGGRRKLRLWPFFGRADTPEGGKRGFLLWPFFTWRREQESRQFMVWPFYGRRETATATETSILYPIFHHREDLLTGGKDVAVWPFWRRATGSDALEVRRYWPLYEYRRAGYSTTEYLAWPFLRRTYVDEPHQFGKYLWAVPFYRKVQLVSRKTGEQRTKTFVWPLLRLDRSSKGDSEIAIPLISPVDAPVIRRIGEPIRPFISIYHRRLKANGERETSALFGLVMARRTRETKKVRLIGGLLGWERTPKGRYLRLLWGIRLRLGDSK